jgi:DNA replication protein DnaC
VRDLSAEGGAAEEDRLLSRYLKPELLIIDDMGLKGTAREERRDPP